jgi:alpha-D-ribose 1-methylphosphonate 5-triphosphate diphosphatase
MNRYRFVNGRVVLANEIAEDATVSVEAGVIVALGADARPAETQVDLGGFLLLPGLIDLHADALEKEIEPRPGTFLPIEVALHSSDRRNAICGIATVFHGLSFAEGELGVRDLAMAESIARAIHEFRRRSVVDHRVHVRYEVTDPKSEAVVVKLIEDGVAGILSFMDHTPGQGQFREVAAYREYLSRVYHLDAAAFDCLLDRKRAEAAGAFDRIKRLAALAHTHGVALAGHDDEGAGRIELMRDLGAAFSEFPVNLETARAAREAGIATLFGAPNVLRGKSQSSSMSARAAIESELVSCLCSDYSPPTMLPAAFTAAATLDKPLADMIAMLTRGPADAIGAAQSGRIAVHCKADFIVVSGTGPPLVASLWRAGCNALTVGAGQNCERP